MTKLRRTTTLVVAVALLTVGTVSTAFATNGAAGEAGETDRAQHRVGMGEATNDATPTPILDRDRDRDRITDRDRDRAMDVERDPIATRDRDRDRECVDGVAADRPTDCPSTGDEVRPWLERCVNWIETHTDLELERNQRWVWRICHRLVWNHVHPV